jgi:hypothetical protein
MNSGLHTMFFARYFDGEFVTRVLTKVFHFGKIKINILSAALHIYQKPNFQEAIQLQRVNLMYQLLSMEGNVGNLPNSFRHAMSCGM